MLPSCQSASPSTKRPLLGGQEEHMDLHRLQVQDQWEANSNLRNAHEVHS